MFLDSDKQNVSMNSREENGANETHASAWHSPGWTAQLILNVVLVILAGINIYWVTTLKTGLNEFAMLQADRQALLTRRMDAADEQFARMSGEVQVARDRLGLTSEELERARAVTAALRKQQVQAVKKLNDAIAQKASAEELSRLQSDAEQRFTNLSGDLARTNDSLTGARGELSGEIARTHDELVALAHRSDRDFYEFTLPRKGAREKVGSVQIELTKTDTKRNRFTVNLFFDDKRIERKDRALLEPVLFYVSGGASPVELVVNQLSKNSVSGYVSTPRGLYAGVPNVLTERPGL